jgi:methionine-rich copper-binding protein CopC
MTRFVRPTLLRRLVPAVVVAAAVAAPMAMRADMIPHLRLKASFPAKDTTLAAAPEAVKLWLTEPTDMATSKIAVTDAAGAAVATEKLTRGAQSDDPVVAKFAKAPGDGKYTVTWKAMSKDGHVVDGTYGFTVKLAK